MAKDKGRGLLLDIELDFDVLSELQDLDAEGSQAFFKHLVELFINEANRHLVDLRGSLDPLVPESAARLVHRLRSSSANLGAVSFAKLCERLEREIRSVAPALPHLEELVQQLETQLPQLELALRQLVSGHRHRPAP